MKHLRRSSIFAAFLPAFRWRSAVFVGAFAFFFQPFSWVLLFFFFEGFQSNVKDVLESCWRSNVSEPLNPSAIHASEPHKLSEVHAMDPHQQANLHVSTTYTTTNFNIHTPDAQTCQTYFTHRSFPHANCCCISKSHVLLCIRFSKKTATKPTIAYTGVNCLTCQPSKNWPKQAPHNHQKPNEPVLVFTADTHVNPSNKGPQLPTRRFLSAASAPPQNSSRSSNEITRHTRSF